MLHRTRDLLIRQRTQLINALRAHLAEYGFVAEKGREGVAELAAIVSEESNRQCLPVAMKQALQALLNQLAALQRQIGELDRGIHAQHRANDVSRRLETIPGIGVIGATAIASTVADPSAFKSGRDFAAWIGLVPRQNSNMSVAVIAVWSVDGDADFACAFAACIAKAQTIATLSRRCLTILMVSFIIVCSPV